MLEILHVLGQAIDFAVDPAQVDEHQIIGFFAQAHVYGRPGVRIQ
jgi:hypothetical protein